jgi:hypothetical protein
MKNNRPQFKRVLALDVHAVSFGYAVLENGELLYWGTSRWKADDGARMELAVSRLMNRWDPTQVVVREGTPSRQAARITKLARKSGVPVVTIPRSLERKTFGPSCANRFDRAAAVASRYAKLESRVPEKRKLWGREPFQIRLFNAIAAGLAYVQAKPGMASRQPSKQACPL